MKILMLFCSSDTRTNSELFERYLPQMVSISKVIDEFHIGYIGKGMKKAEWEKYFIFHQAVIPEFLIKYPSIFSRHVLFRLVCRQLSNLKVDMIYALSGMLQKNSLMLSKRMNVPLVLRLRGDVFEIEAARPKKKRTTHPFRLPSFTRNYFQIKSLKQADLIIPISESLKTKAIGWGVKKSKISTPVHNGVDIETFKPLDCRKKNKEALIIGYAGRISYEKRIDKLVSIVERLSNVILVIAGVWQVPRFELPDNVRYIGHLHHNEMANFYSGLDVTVLPSSTEGLPNVILESYACGVPVLCTEEAFPFHDLKLFGFVSKLDDFSECINTDIKKNNVFPKLGLSAREYVSQNFTWEKFGNKIKINFENALDAKRNYK